VTGDAQRGPSVLPQLRLDDLLDELQSRLDMARATRDRMHSLLEAMLEVGRELELDQALRHIVEAAVSLVDARYGALGVVGDGLRLSRFIPVGLDEDEVAAIGPLPEGHGILGELIRHPAVLRLRELSEHPSSYGLPANHPPMHTFLGAPIRVRGEVFGNLYLTEKRGGAEFDAEDESVLSVLAVAAGVAIDNARLYGEARQRERWLTASAEVTNSLLSGRSQTEVLHLVVDRAREIAGADLVAIALPTADQAQLSVVLAAGEGADRHQGLVLPVEGSFMGAAVRSHEAITSIDIQKDPRITAGPPRWEGLGPATAVRMGTVEGGVRGVLLLARVAGGPAFTTDDSAALLGFAGQAALGLELAERRLDSEQVALLEDRDRIARDLHDLAIQRLFATGMTLQSAERFIDHPQAAERVQRAVDDLDATVKIIRSTIFGLRARDTGPDGRSLRARIVGAVEQAAPVLGFTPSLRMEGLLDTEVSTGLAEHLLAVLGEALTNTARHARATSCDVRVSATGKELALVVSDDGVGIPGGGQRGGLANLAERALQCGGEFTAEPGESGGTCLSWRVPLAHD
jgi:signal transduction histidine kinase